MAPTARDVLDRLRAATITQSIADLRELYAPDAIYEFPFVYPGVPARFDGRDAIIDWITAGWQADVPCYARYRTHAIHDTADPNTIVIEQEASAPARSPATSPCPTSWCSPSTKDRSATCATTSTSPRRRPCSARTSLPHRTTDIGPVPAHHIESFPR